MNHTLSRRLERQLEDRRDARRRLLRRRGAKSRAALTGGGSSAASGSGGVNRRDFLMQGAGAGLALGLPPLLLSCGGNDDDGTASRVTHTLFFNFAHEAHGGKSYFIEGGGQSMRLTPVAERPDVLQRERAGNVFLRAVPDDQITHHVEGFVIPGDSVAIVYVGADIDRNAGTWQMTSMHTVIPPRAVQVAHERARARIPSGPLPLSAARSRYGLPAAQSAQDLIDESALLDPSGHAATLIASHPDLMALEPTAAATVHHNHVGRSISAVLLSNKIAQLGPALPQTTPGTPNATGWGSLQPLFNADGTPARLKSGPDAGRLQYHTVLHPDVKTLAGQGAVGTTSAVKDDETLGADITTLKTPGAYAGALWYRRDGRPNVDQSPSAGFTASNAQMTLKQQGPQSGLDVSATMTTNTDGSISVTLTATNWYLRYLGLFLQFLDGDTVLKLADLPEYTGRTIIDPSIHSYPGGSPDYSFDSDDTMYGALVPAVTTVMGVPLEFQAGAGSASVTILKPAKATAVRVLCGGLGTGSNNYPGTIGAGIGMTAFFCYGVTILCGAAGAGAKYPLIIEAIADSLDKIASVLAAALVDDLSGSTPASAQFWGDQALSIAETIIGTQGGTLLSTVIGVIVAIVAESELEKVIPIVGIVSQIISAAIAAADLILTTVDVALSPWTYVNDLVFTYDLSVTLQKDETDDTFPKAATAYTVTAMFDDGTPHVQTHALTAPIPSSLPPVVFKSVPLGGNVNVSVGFAQKATTLGQADILLGKGTTGLIANNANTAPTFAIEEIAFPIDSTTTYQHRQKTTLDAAGNHVWAAAPAPTANLGNTTCGAAGTACGFRGISVRQGTSSARGYLGYAWQSQNSDASKGPSCVGGGVGQLDQLANLNTDSGNNGANAQQGYANATCGVGVPGVKVAYSLLSHAAANFYLDTTDPSAPMVRQVVLEPTPSFASPLSGQSFGVLNLPSDSLLLHPAGHLISINNANHKIETHKLPAASLADADAKVQLIAQVRSGKGTRPGLLDLPVAAAVAPNGVILVLEAGNNRIQAFDLGANPVPLFKKQSGPGKTPHSLTLGGTDPAQGWQYLDLAVEYTGYLYVLAYNENTFVYRLDLYHPDQADNNPISTTLNINAARLTVDLWRNVYALNYEVLLLPGGAAAGLTEPSVSLWTPCDVGRTC